jgi:uncharacterized membrane protein YedE/YeeE
MALAPAQGLARLAQNVEGAMDINWLYGLLGGLVIGTAGAIYLLVNGRIMGPSGSLGGLMDGSDRSGEQWGFVAGLIAAPAVAALIIPMQTYASSNWIVLVIGGLLVGFGTRLANGCTSGHGVCGISRLSPRGIVASASYVGAGMVVMTVLRHVWGVI